ncbi:hypothetical protein CROQUDRAFT_366430 [Cronartium quercuum f. sp. fusiforme G11]|uniref:DUF7872 domain-containing protein n=1 Tax=Cronartium quercuum f. sp. fusiforme G11 TaxID=708437 RepID=A0A9P6N6F2_9BASI|nr:hypothetical protein CROQUDRAFT_366430 [Cronartium quercuum f. sp. fusiforme G11]
MMTIVTIRHEEKLKNKIYNANRIKIKYGIVIEDIIQSAWLCQKKYGVYSHDFNFNFSENLNSSRYTECMFNIPICDLTRPDIHQLWIKSGSIVKSCRELGKLPI